MNSLSAAECRHVARSTAEVAVLNRVSRGALTDVVMHPAATPSAARVLEALGSSWRFEVATATHACILALIPYFASAPWPK